MNEYRLNDMVKYKSNKNQIADGYISRYLRNGMIIIEDENNNVIEKINYDNLIMNMSWHNEWYNEWYNYTNYLQDKLNNYNIINEELIINTKYLVYALIIIICILLYIVCINGYFISYIMK